MQTLKPHGQESFQDGMLQTPWGQKLSHSGPFPTLPYTQKSSLGYSWVYYDILGNKLVIWYANWFSEFCEPL